MLLVVDSFIALHWAGLENTGGDDDVGHHLDKARLVEKGFLLVVALAHPGRAGGKDQVLLGGLVVHAVHGEAGELLWGFSLVQLHLFFSRLLGRLLWALTDPTGALVA